MALCSSLLARWRRFLGRLSPAHALLFQLLFLALLAANIAGVVITVRRLQHSYAVPISVFSVRRLQEPPSFTVVWQTQGSSNASLTCTLDVHDASAPACPQRSLTSPLQWGAAVWLVVGVSNRIPFAPGDPTFAMALTAVDARAGDCFDMQLLAVTMDSITADNLVSLSDHAPLSSQLAFCPPMLANQPYRQHVWLSFSALQDVHGHITFSIRVSSDSAAGSMQPGDMPPTLMLDIDLHGGMPVQWETQELAYTLADALASIFAYINISLTLLAFLFPWRYIDRLQAEGRSFKLACGDKHPDDAVNSEADVEAGSFRSQQLQERMLPRASLSSTSSPLDADRATLARDPDFELAVRRVMAEWRGAASPTD